MPIPQLQMALKSIDDFMGAYASLSRADFRSQRCHWILNLHTLLHLMTSPKRMISKLRLVSIQKMQYFSKVRRVTLDLNKTHK